MKKQEIRMICIILLIGIIIICIIIAAKNKRKENEEWSAVDNNLVEEKYVEVLDDGTKLNTSNNLSKTKELDGLKISDIQLTHRNGVSVIIATVTNTNSYDVELTPVILTLYDDQRNVLKEVNGLISPVKSGESVQLNVVISKDYANVFDFTIRKK